MLHFKPFYSIYSFNTFSAAPSLFRVCIWSNKCPRQWRTYWWGHFLGPGLSLLRLYVTLEPDSSWATSTKRGTPWTSSGR